MTLFFFMMLSDLQPSGSTAAVVKFHPKTKKTKKPIVIKISYTLLLCSLSGYTDHFAARRFNMAEDDLDAVYNNADDYGAEQRQRHQAGGQRGASASHARRHKAQHVSLFSVRF